MMTESEKARLRAVEGTVHDILSQFDVNIEQDGEVKEGIQAQAIGTVLASIDALFAIREGDEWRGLTEPSEIAGQILRDLGLAD